MRWWRLSRMVAVFCGGALAGIRAGDRIAGIDRTVLASSAHAGRLLALHQIGDEVPYLLRREQGLEEVRVHLGRRFVGSAPYFFACLLGFAFFGATIFVRRRQPELRAAQIFHLVGALPIAVFVAALGLWKGAGIAPRLTSPGAEAGATRCG